MPCLRNRNRKDWMMGKNSITAVLLSFSISALAGPILIPFLRRLKCGQTVRDDGPAAHLKKSGTPTMGGILILASVLATSAAFMKEYPRIAPVLFLTVGFGLVGLTDDYIKVVCRRSMGLSAWQKLFGQLVVTGGFAWYLVRYADVSLAMKAPWMPGKYLDFGVWNIPILFFIVLGTANGTNFTDGLDGLANGVSAISATTMLVIALLASEAEVAIVMAALVGACVGFMPYNLNPAKMFMGDTGATFLGYILATMSIQGLFKFYAVISFAVPFLILGLPIFDTAFAFIRRIAHGQSPMHADRGHIHHRLIDMGLNQKQAVATLYVISAMLGLSAVVLTTGGEQKAMLFFLTLCIAAAIAARVVFPKEIREELHEEMEELRELGRHGGHTENKEVPGQGDKEG